MSLKYFMGDEQQESQEADVPAIDPKTIEADEEPKLGDALSFFATNDIVESPDINPTTGELVPDYANGLTADQPINQSPLSALDRAKLSFSDEKGKEEFLKNKFGALHKNKHGRLTVPVNGKWHVIDKDGFEWSNPYELSAEIIGDLADVSKEVLGIGAAIGTAAATGGASIPLQAGAMLASGAGASILGNSVMGKMSGTYQGDIDEMLTEAGTEGVLNALGVFIAPAGKLASSALKPYAKAAVTKIDDIMDLAKGTLKEAGVLKVFDDVTSALGRAAIGTAKFPVTGPINLAKQIQSLGSGVAVEEMEYAATRYAPVRKIIKEAVKAGDPKGYVGKESGKIVTDIAKMVPKAMNDKFGRSWDLIQKQTEKTLGKKFMFDSSAPYQGMVAHIQKVGVLDDAGKMLSRSEIAKMPKNQITQALDDPSNYNRFKKLFERISDRASIKSEGKLRDVFKTRGEITDMLDDLVSQNTANGKQQLNQSIFALKDSFEKIFEESVERNISKAFTVPAPQGSAQSLLSRTIKGANEMRKEQMRNSADQIISAFRKNNKEYQDFLVSSKSFRDIAKLAKNDLPAAQENARKLGEKMYKSYFAETGDEAIRGLRDIGGLSSMTDDALESLASRKTFIKSLAKTDRHLEKAYTTLIDAHAAAAFTPILSKKVLQYVSVFGASGAVITGDPTMAAGMTLAGALLSPRYAVQTAVGAMAGSRAVSATAKKAAFQAIQAFKKNVALNPKYLTDIASNPNAAQVVGQGINQAIQQAVQTEEKLKAMMQGAQGQQ